MRVKLAVAALAVFAGLLVGACGHDTGSPPPAVAVARESAPRKVLFVGSKNSNIYHLPTCRSAAKILGGNLVSFSSRDEAVKAGYRACEVCKP